jgi:ankyrin repeat protein
MDICKFCGSQIDDHFKQSECKQKSFVELVNDSKISESNANVEQAKGGELGIIRWLLKNANRKELQDSEIEIIVENCSNSSEEEIVNILKQNDVYIEVDVDNLVDDTHEWLSSALHYAIKLGTPEIITWILENSVNSHVTAQHLSFTIEAAINNLKNLIKLVSLGADVTKVPVVHLITELCQKGNLSVLKWLLANSKVTESFPEILPYTLHCAAAAANANFLFVEYLVQNGANLNPVLKKKNYNDETYLQLAAEFGNINYIKWLIENGADFSDTKYRDSLVCIAAEHGHLDLLKWLVSKGCNIHEVDEEQNNALHKAALNVHLNCIEYLVHKNVDINPMNSEKCSPMYYAASSKNLGIVRFLVAHGGDIHGTHCDANTLLHAAANSLEMIQLLVSLGLDINARNSKNENVLSLAAEQYNHKAVEWLLEKGLPVDDLLKVVFTSKNWLLNIINSDPNLETLKIVLKYISDINLLIDAETLLHKAIDFSCGSIEVIKLLVENKVDVNKLKTSDKSSPLICSLNQNNLIASCSFQFYSIIRPKSRPDIAQYLLSQGPDVTVRNMQGETALYHAIFHQNIDIIKQIIELGADINAVTNDGTSILQKAVLIKSLKIVQLLVELGADVNHINNINLSCLNIAAQNESYDIVKYLVEKGANINHESYTSFPALFYAFESKNMEQVHWLINNGANINLIRNNLNLHECTEYGNKVDKLDYITLLINNGVNINELNGNIETILHTCIDDVEIVDYLLERGISINERNIQGKTELHICIEKENSNVYCQNKSRIVNKLIRRGAIVNTADNDGVTPLHLAASDPLNIEIVRVLIANGADVKASDSGGDSVLHYTADREIAMLLCEKGADVNCKNKEGVTVLQTTIEKSSIIKKKFNRKVKSLNVVKSLESRILNKNGSVISESDISSIMYSRFVDYIEYLIDNVDDINEKDSQGCSALNYATSNPKIFDVLLKKGAIGY